MVFCSNCGEKQALNANFCSKCGTKVGNSGPISSPKSSPSTTKPAVNSSGWNKYSSAKSNSPAPIKSSFTSGGSVQAVSKGYAKGDQSTFNSVGSSGSADVKCGLAKTTYEKQPSWAYAEQHKNNTGQYKHGQFRHLNE